MFKGLFGQTVENGALRLGKSKIPVMTVQTDDRGADGGARPETACRDLAHDPDVIIELGSDPGKAADF